MVGSGTRHGRFVALAGLGLAVVLSGSACNKEEPVQMGQNRPAGPTPVSTAAPVDLYSNGNTLGIQPGATAPSTFTVEAGSVRLVTLTTYHYVAPKGVQTTGKVGLKGSDGKVYGPWDTTGSDGQGGIKNAFWVATIDLVLTAGTYTVTDTDPATWSSNARTGGAGMFWASGYKLG